MPIETNIWERGPYTQLATFCEHVLQEADGVVSLIRIVNIITHTERGPDAPEEMPEIRYPLHLVISLRSGTARGRHEVTIIPEKPSGETLSPVSTSVAMEGEAKGANIITRLDIPYKLEGLYWFTIQFDQKVLTRIPLEVRYSRIVSGPAKPSQ